MTGRWNPTNHTISDFKDWDDDSKLVIQPDFQRKAVWNPTSKVMLIDTILKKYPIPKVFIQNTTEHGRTIRKIIDGQQRITAILEFVNNNFILDKPYIGAYEGKSFAELPENERDNILQYTIDCNEAYGYTEEQYREIYTRLNKYTVPLNSQELRKAEFPGNFYTLSEKLAASEILDSWKIFTISSRRRLLDVEFISEILAALLEGPQDKKATLDDFYRRYNDQNLVELESRFNQILKEIEFIFPDNLISKSRFKQKADFYSLVLAVDFYVKQGLTLNNTNISPLQEDFNFLNQQIDPSEDSSGTILQEYAIRCVSSANTVSSRKWRFDFLRLVLSGTFLRKTQFLEILSEYRSSDSLRKFLEFYDFADPIYHDSGMCPLGASTCVHCEDEIDLDDEKWSIAWNIQGPFQSSNLSTIHKECFCIEDYLEYRSSFYPEEKSEFIDDLLQGLE
jgi:hypothetical protein